MIITYPKHGNGDEFVLDTTELDFIQVCDWARATLKASRWQTILKVAMYDVGVPDTALPGGTVVFTSCDVMFYDLPQTVNGETIALVGARELVKQPENMVRAIAMLHNVVGVDLNNLKYTDPDTPKPGQEDWQVAGSPLGPPVASKPGWFMNKFTGHTLGKNWSGPSGATYRMSEDGQGFSRFVGWKKV